jgi:4-diphosphocytidyl-2-C-methyl-D-erythritol kinase
MTARTPGERSQGTTARTVAQAKVNLLLRVLAKEANGYHQIETLFCRLDLGDTVLVRTHVRGKSLECTGDAIPAGGLGPVEQNLAWRAAAAYAAVTGWPNAWSIEIDKRIPVGGGLGGGSADAGAVLRCLNAIAPTPVSERELLSIATPLGADVPFMAIESPLALAWGRGERLLALPPIESRSVTLVCFPFGVSTPDAYKWLDEEQAGASPQGGSLDLDALSSWDGIARIAHNDFEAVVAPRHGDIATALTALRSLTAASEGKSEIAMLAGTGATVFMIGSMPAPVIGGTHGRPLWMVATRTADRVVAVEASD